MDNEQENKRLKQEIQQIKQDTQQIKQDTQRIQQKIAIVKFLKTAQERVLNDESTAFDTVLYSMILALNALEQRAYLEGTLQGKISTTLNAGL